jgi:hypothetical protein
MTDYANFIRFGENGTLSGNIASISYDLDITGEEFSSTNPKAPVFRLLYQFSLCLTDWRMSPFAQADRHDAPRLIHEFSPGIAAVVEDIVV